MPDRWISLHAFHQAGTDLLLGTAVDGLVRELDGRLDRFFFLRYWEGGPHLRLRLLPRVPDDAVMIEKRATAVLEEHLAAYPTTVTWDRERYALLAQEFARQEGLVAYDHRLRPDDHVEAIAYRPEYATFGGPQAVAAVERHFTDSSRIALAILRGEHDHRRRLGHALAAMMLALMSWEPDPRRLAPLLARERDRWDPAPARARQGEIFTKQREALTAQAERCRLIAARPASSESHAPAPSADGPPPGGVLDAGDARDSLGAWWRSIDTLHRRLVALQRAGVFYPVHREGASRTPGRPRIPDTPGPAGVDTPVDAERHDVLIVLNRCVHLFCNRLGLSIVEEAHLRYLTAVTLDGLAQKEGTS
ncbi:lantibiotic dehydratase C-terminal domain-containing protein [Nonomuraea angiospora]|uniref:lantibiotic dehydratase C-terminal domain-containing protein n=1 Tax=Nonomuraea angiospora TaxID=46172 RepID=UPI00344D62BC